MQDQTINGYGKGIESDSDRANWEQERRRLEQALDSAETRIRDLEAQLNALPESAIVDDRPPVNYLLMPHEAIPDGIRRITLEQADLGYWQLTESTWHSDLAVHDARKAFKRVRAALRLVRDETGSAVYRRENIVYRDASRRLSGMRDSAVMALTLAKLVAHYADELPDDAFAVTYDRIMEMHTMAVRTIIDEGTLLDQTAALITSARPRLVALPVTDETFTTVQQGVTRVYRRGRRAMARALQDETPHTFHDWRKRVKYLRYQMGILSNLWPAIIDVLASQLELLSDTLGDEHDLYELSQLVQRKFFLCDDAVERDHLLALIDRRRRELQMEARPLGARLYAEMPHQFSARMAAYWQTLCDEL
ncbi:MAG: CHAD domain-containing protein [Anaerolineae bacterium]|nr:CHAD domain-containing protein [Anaerolineae bacterium]MCO5196597.1 CHAD domain-containing protein [Anaerolineae bacterium]